MRTPPPTPYDLRLSFRQQSVMPFLSGTPPTKGRTIGGGGGERRAKYKKNMRAREN